MKFPRILAPLAAGAVFLALGEPAFAGTVDQNDAFYTFYTTIDSWASGALGVGIATTMLVLGGAIGVAQNSPMPALSGIGGAAFLHWGPQIIKQVMLQGGLM